MSEENKENKKEPEAPKGGKAALIAWDTKTTLEEKKKTLYETVHALGGTPRPTDKNPKPTDKKTLTITRDDALGLALLQTSEGQAFMNGQDRLMCNFGLLMDLTAFALNRNVWNFEFGSNGVGVELLERFKKRMLENWEEEEKEKEKEES